MTKSVTKVQDKDTNKRLSVVRSKDDPTKYWVVILNPDGSKIKWPKGDKWDAATISVGTTTTWNPGTNASVTNSWTSSAAVLDFTIPRGNKWDKGDPWTDAWEYMTQAQYDELPSSKLTDWISRMIYSEQEFFFKTLLRATNNLLHYNQQDELYADLQLQNWLTPTSAFPIWVNVWNVDSTDWWTQSWVMINAKTTDWTYMRWLYGDDGKLYFDGGLWVFKTIATTDDISSALGDLRNELSTVAFTWLSSDLNNDAGFDSMPVMTQSQYDNTPWTAGDNKRYLIFEEI